MGHFTRTCEYRWRISLSLSVWKDVFLPLWIDSSSCSLGCHCWPVTVYSHYYWTLDSNANTRKITSTQCDPKITQSPIVIHCMPAYYVGTLLQHKFRHWWKLLDEIFILQHNINSIFWSCCLENRETLSGIYLACIFQVFV
jgi:hypothetical protein